MHATVKILFVFIVLSMENYLFEIAGMLEIVRIIGKLKKIIIPNILTISTILIIPILYPLTNPQFCNIIIT